MVFLWLSTQLPKNSLDFLRKRVAINQDVKLENVLTEWTQKQTTDITWNTILKALQAIGRKDLATKVIEYLEMPRNYQEYITMKDFSPYPDIDFYEFYSSFRDFVILFGLVYIPYIHVNIIICTCFFLVCNFFLNNIAHH